MSNSSTEVDTWAAFAQPASHSLRAPFVFRPELPAANVGTAVLLFLISLVLAIFSPICFFYCNGQLHEIETGLRAPDGRSVLGALRAVSAFITCLWATLVVVLFARVAAHGM